MELKAEYKKIIRNSSKIALATSTYGIPNVRIVNYCYDDNKEGTIYFTTLKGTPKEKEFALNENIAFTTVPDIGREHVRVLNATIRKSVRTLEELKELFTAQIPGFLNTYEVLGTHLVVYEVLFKNVTISLASENGNLLL